MLCLYSGGGRGKMHKYPRRQKVANIASSQVRLGYETGWLQPPGFAFWGLFEYLGGYLLSLGNPLII